MKKIIGIITFMVVLCSVAFLACEKDTTTVFNETQENEGKSQENNLRMKNDQNIVGHYDGSTFTFEVDKREILKNWNDNLKKLSEIDANLTDVKFVKLDSIYVLRASGSEYKSTVALNTYETKGNNVFLTGGSISCTTKSCSDNESCTPNFAQTKCVPPCNKGTKDCSKTVTSGYSIIERHENVITKS